MKIDLEKIEKLSALKLSGEERTKILKDIEEIISYFDNLKEVDTENVEPMVYLNESKLFLRKDEIKVGLSVKDIEKLRELFYDGFFKVKRIIGE
ncbi:MAG: Asp-tRNA(Asn)/Glu-tRNA(Gln) amidotransferase subunit GatC [Caldisericaceae bacterium]